MVDSRAKGQRAEYAVRDILRKHTGLGWERVPGSGGFGVQHGLKGDIYIPETDIVHCIEVKHYKTDVINSNLFSDTESQLEKFWSQTVREAEQLGREPLLVFKKDRGKWIVVTLLPNNTKHTIIVRKGNTIMTCMLFDDWLKDKNKEYFLK